MRKRHRRFRSEVRKDLSRIYINISEEAINWFHNLSVEMKKAGGYRLPRSYIVRALIDVFMKLHIKLRGIKTEKELKRRILEAVKRYS